LVPTEHDRELFHTVTHWIELTARTPSTRKLYLTRTVNPTRSCSMLLRMATSTTLIFQLVSQNLLHPVVAYIQNHPRKTRTSISPLNSKFNGIKTARPKPRRNVKEPSTGSWPNSTLTPHRVNAKTRAKERIWHMLLVSPTLSQLPQQK
jgi:hypothetical protein